MHVCMHACLDIDIYACVHVYIIKISIYIYIYTDALFGGAYSLEDGLAPCGGEGWAPPHSHARKLRYFTRTRANFGISLYQCSAHAVNCLTVLATRVNFSLTLT